MRGDLKSIQILTDIKTLKYLNFRNSFLTPESSSANAELLSLECQSAINL